jgi:hypothetical protein
MISPHGNFNWIDFSVAKIEGYSIEQLRVKLTWDMTQWEED